MGRKKEPGRGFTATFYVKDVDIDFWNAFLVWCKLNKLNKSEAMMIILKNYFFSNSKILNDFKDIYNQVIDHNIENSIIRFAGNEMKLKDLLDEEFIYLDTQVRVR